MSKASKSSTYMSAAFAVISFVLLIGNVYLVKSLVVFGSPLLFAIGIFAEVALLTIFIYSLLRALTTPIGIILSIVLSAWSGILTNPYIKKFHKKHKKISKWVASRFDTKKPLGLYLTLGVFVTVMLLNGFYNILHNVISHGPVTQIDARVINLMPSLRTPLQNDFFRFITFTDSSASILLLALVAGVILWRSRQRIAALSFLVAIIAVELAYSIPKQLVHRMRPESALSIHAQKGLSFPSGHAVRATVLSGLLAYLLLRSFKSTLARFVIVFAYLIVVVMVAISRVYLGVHYPSDVAAGIFLGGALLTMIITAIEIISRYQLWGQNVKSFRSKQLLIVPAIIIFFSLAVSPSAIHLKNSHKTNNYTALNNINKSTVRKLPAYSETLSGKSMEPINFIYLGSGAQITQQFLSHGWYEADRSTVANTLKALAVGFQGRQYLNAPVTPSFLAAEPEDLAFQQPTKANTLRERHHTRLWKTNFKLEDGREVWVATASYDEGIELSGSAKIPTHHIDPNVDAERSYIANSLDLKNVRYLQLVKPQAGKNAGGDIFFTDGRVLVVDLARQ